MPPPSEFFGKTIGDLESKCEDMDPEWPTELACHVPASNVPFFGIYEDKALAHGSV
jgi:hypothetical protein